MTTVVMEHIVISLVSLCGCPLSHPRAQVTTDLFSLWSGPLWDFTQVGSYRVCLLHLASIPHHDYYETQPCCVILC